MKSDLRYATSDCFETFPFPESTTVVEGSELEQAASALYERRAAYMIAQQVGLTETYNRLTDPVNLDPEVVALRELHLNLDRTVLAAYGWQDIEVPTFETPTTDEGRAVLQAFEDEVVDRLFALNAERAEQERLLAASTSVGGKKGKPTGKGGKNSSKQGKLI